MSAAHDKSLAELEGELVSAEDRARILSARRLKVTLTLFMTMVVLGLSVLMFGGVDRIFAWLTPSISNDLQHKALHGTLELAQSAQLGLVTEDARAVASAVEEYERDSDVVGLVVMTHESSRVLYNKPGSSTRLLTDLLSREKSRVHDLGSQYGAWTSSEIEGTSIGKVALLVSKARLAAGEQLRREVLGLAAIGCCVALLASLVFVSMYIGPILRVTGRTFERLERKTEEALAAARLKTQFLANMSHEIRTPMNGIIGVLDLLNRTPLSAKQQRYTQTIDSSARSLLTIINDILDFSKLEVGKYELRQHEFELTQLVQDTTELLSPKAHAKGLDLVVRTSPEVPEWVRGDSDRVKQVLINLLGNAIKFTEHGHIELRVEVSEETPEYLMLRFAIIDTGPGIRQEDQARLFGVFSQVDGELTRKYGGTGLGLAISRRIAEAMGGACGVESELGVGSTFWFTAKVGRAAKKAAQGSPEEKPEVRILVASPSDVQRTMLGELMQRWGMHYELASSSEQASELLLSQSGRFNAVVLDGNLPSTSGDGPLLSDLCLVEDLPMIRLLATTEVAPASSATNQAFLWKPVRVSELYNSIVAVSTGKELSLQRRAAEVAEGVETSGNGCVLVVDDNEVNRLVACELLQELGYESDTACNGQEAFEKVRDESYDLVLMDCQMPVVDGFQATAMIRALSGPKAGVPIIALTAHAMVDDRDRVLRGGMDDYATKPVRGRVLASLLKRWIPGKAGLSLQPASRSQPSAAQANTVETPRADLQAPATDSDAILLDETLPRSQRAVELFLQTVPELVAALTRAVNANDHAKVKQLAHKLKGNCLSLGVNRMAAACHRLELAAATGSIDTSAHERIAPELAAVTPLLTKVLDKEANNDTRAASA